MNDEYHILYFKDGQILFLVASIGVANIVYKRDRAIVKMSSYYDLGELLDDVYPVTVKRTGQQS